MTRDPTLTATYQVAGIVALVVLAFGGYVLNLLAILQGTESARMLSARALGMVIPPLGAVLGWL